MPAGFLGLRSKSGEHLLIGDIELGKRFFNSRNHSSDNLNHVVPQGVEFEPQLFYIPIALFTATIGIAHEVTRTILRRIGIAQIARASSTAAR